MRRKSVYFDVVPVYDGDFEEFTIEVKHSESLADIFEQECRKRNIDTRSASTRKTT